MTKSKTKSKKELFDDEEFDAKAEDTMDESENDEIALEDLDIQPDEIPPEELVDVSTEELSNIEEIANNIEEEDDIVVPLADVGDDIEETKEEEVTTTKSVVIQCPHCKEEVLDMDICPLCGNKLQLTADAVAPREEFDPIMEEDEAYEVDEEEKYLKKRGMDSLFDGLPYQNDYPSSDTI